MRCPYCFEPLAWDEPMAEHIEWCTDPAFDDTGRYVPPAKRKRPVAEGNEEEQ